MIDNIYIIRRENIVFETYQIYNPKSDKIIIRRIVLGWI